MVSLKKVGGPSRCRTRYKLQSTLVRSFHKNYNVLYSGNANVYYCIQSAIRKGTPAPVGYSHIPSTTVCTLLSGIEMLVSKLTSTFYSAFEHLESVSSFSAQRTAPTPPFSPTTIKQSYCNMPFNMLFLFRTSR